MRDVYQTLTITKKRMAESTTLQELMDEYRNYRIYLRLMHIRGGRLSYTVYNHLRVQIKMQLHLCEQGLK